MPLRDEAVKLLNEMRGDDEFPRFSLRLFLSVDVVGSTAYKHKRVSSSRPRIDKDDPAPAWLSTFGKFYSDFQKAFNRIWEDQKKSAPEKSGRIGDPPQYWKALGDEILFVKVLEDSFEAGFALECFRRAIIEYRSEVQGDDPKLNLKGAAWLAGFPINNLSVVIGYDDDLQRDIAHSGGPHTQTFLQHLKLFRLQKEIKEAKENGTSKPAVQHEFIGPQMDLGFRVASKATPRRLMVSADLMYLIASTHETDGRRRSEMIQVDIEKHAGFDGTTELKGVLSGTPYPLFWIDSDTDNALHSLKDALLPRTGISGTKVIEYCAEFIEQATDDWVVRPFIFNGGTLKHGMKANPDYELFCKRRDSYRAHIQNGIEKVLSSINPEEPDKLEAPVKIDTLQDNVIDLLDED